MMARAVLVALVSGAVMCALLAFSHIARSADLNRPALSKDFAAQEFKVETRKRATLNRRKKK